MLSCLRDTRTSIAGDQAEALCPTNLTANLAENARARLGGSLMSGCGPKGIFCLNSGGTSE